MKKNNLQWLTYFQTVIVMMHYHASHNCPSSHIEWKEFFWRYVIYVRKYVCNEKLKLELPFQLVGQNQICGEKFKLTGQVTNSVFCKDSKRPCWPWLPTTIWWRPFLNLRVSELGNLQFQGFQAFFIQGKKVGPFWKNIMLSLTHGYSRELSWGIQQALGAMQTKEPLMHDNQP